MSHSLEIDHFSHFCSSLQLALRFNPYTNRLILSKNSFLFSSPGTTFKAKISVSLCLCAHRYTYMCLNKYLSNKDAMHGVYD